MKFYGLDSYNNANIQETDHRQFAIRILLRIIFLTEFLSFNISVSFEFWASDTAWQLAGIKMALGLPPLPLLVDVFLQASIAWNICSNRLQVCNRCLEKSQWIISTSRLHVERVPAYSFSTRLPESTFWKSVRPAELFWKRNFVLFILHLPNCFI